MTSKMKPTIYDVASEAGVSPATVSRVINNNASVVVKTRERVIEAMKRLNYDPPARLAEEPRPARPASPAYTARRGNSPLLILNMPYIANQFFEEVAQGAQAAAAHAGYHLLADLSHFSSMNIDSIINVYAEHGVAGIVVSDVLPEHLMERLTASFSIVQCSEYNPAVPVSCVCVDNRAAAMRAVEYILSTGRKRVVFVSTPMRNQYAQLRLEGYRRALEVAGMRALQEEIMHVSEIDAEIGFQVARQIFLREQPPDAVFAVSDVLAAAVIRAVQSVGLSVPRDVSVMGFDNVQLARTNSPSISTVNQPKYQLGYRAVELLIEHILDPKIQPQKITLDTELIIRESTSA